MKHASFVRFVYCTIQHSIYKISQRASSERMKTMKCRFEGEKLLKLKTIVCCARVDTPSESLRVERRVDD
jgi:hypothetical protein